MKPVVTLWLAGAFFIGAGVAPADLAVASPIRECGRAQAHSPSIYNVTSRKVSCRSARRFARRVITNPSCAEDRYCSYHGWRCTSYALRAEIDTRCVRGSRVIHFQYR